MSFHRIGMAGFLGVVVIGLVAPQTAPAQRAKAAGKAPGDTQADASADGSASAAPATAAAALKAFPMSKLKQDGKMAAVKARPNG